ncbi:unnamed protein product, partial [Microthlaspi erraticum]
MYKERNGGGGGGGSSRSDILGGAIDRKRINDTLNKKLEKSSPSTSRSFASKDKDPFSLASTAKSQLPDVESDTDSEGSDVSGSEGDDTSWISWF